MQEVGARVVQNINTDVVLVRRTLILENMNKPYKFWLFFVFKRETCHFWVYERILCNLSTECSGVSEPILILIASRCLEKK